MAAPPTTAAPAKTSVTTATGAPRETAPTATAPTATAPTAPTTAPLTKQPAVCFQEPPPLLLPPPPAEAYRSRPEPTVTSCQPFHVKFSIVQSSVNCPDRRSEASRTASKLCFLAPSQWGSPSS